MATKSNPATQFPGDYRLAWDQQVFVREFVEAIKAHASEVVEEMRGRLKLTADEREIDTYYVVSEVLEWASEDGEADEEVAAYPPRRVLTQKLWPWAVERGLVEPIEVLREMDSLAKQDGLDPELHYHRAIIGSIFDALKAWGDQRTGSPTADAWSVSLPEGGTPLSITDFAGLDGPDGKAAFLQRGDSPCLATVSRGSGVEYQLNLAVPGWDPLRQTEKEAREVILARVEELLAAKFAAVREAMSESQDGAVSPSYFDPLHFVWLVQFQVLKLPYEQIAKQSRLKRTRPAVHSGVAAAARSLVGPRFQRWLRTSPRGRPKGSSRPAVAT